MIRVYNSELNLNDTGAVLEYYAMTNLKDDFIFDEDILEAEIQALEKENVDFEETFCVCGGFETYKMILFEKKKRVVMWGGTTMTASG